MFLALLFILLNIELAVSIDPKWRRMEFIISGFKDTQSRGYGKPRFSELTVNGKKVFRRTLDRNPPPITDVDSEFIAQTVVNQYDASFDTNLYFWDDGELGDSAFTDPLRFSFNVFYTDNEGTQNAINRTIINATTKDDYRVAPNSDRLIQKIQLSNEVYFDLYVSARCHGYNGLGCRYQCDVGADVPYECLYETNEKICKNQQFNNPPLCNRNDTTCLVNPCLNGGQCVRVFNNITYCNCPPGYMGDICNTTYCDPPCDPDNGECVGPNSCKCTPGWGGPLCDRAMCTPDPCVNGGSCGVLNNEVICECDPSRYGGKLCDSECNPQCIFGTCVVLTGKPACQCFDGFIGETCNTTITDPEPIFEDGYLSLRQQRIIYVAITAAIVLIAVIVFGVGSYQRTHKKRNMRIQKGAETAMRTLQMNQQLNQTLSNAQQVQMKPMNG